MKIKVRVTDRNRIPQLRREMRKLGQSTPAAEPATAPAAPAGNIAAQARALAEAEGLEVEAVFERLCQVQRIRQRLGPTATELDVASCLAAELGVTLEVLLEASGLEMDEEGPA
jgi:hypothetical protein